MVNRYFLKHFLYSFNPEFVGGISSCVDTGSGSGDGGGGGSCYVNSFGSGGGGGGCDGGDC